MVLPVEKLSQSWMLFGNLVSNSNTRHLLIISFLHFRTGTGALNLSVLIDVYLTD